MSQQANLALAAELTRRKETIEALQAENARLRQELADISTCAGIMGSGGLADPTVEDLQEMARAALTQQEGTGDE